ncbi:class D sortase [Congregibacter variabilis]|uniref:Class D sortase n=1 Tax=Congregibacter variabilis TaxID=3081200 RepID=A0ABZ0I1W5_9GAMM|nr:class D sortase [Congregibacter sp. IMCC43200]
MHRAEQLTEDSGKPILEFACYLAGAVLLVFFATVFLRSEVRADQSLAIMPDMQLWSDVRKDAYLRAIETENTPVLAILRAPSLGLSVPVYNSASDLNMDRGAGVIDGMAYPHEPGHIGIAGHRDGYFRTLKDASVGDSLILDTLNGERRFIIEDLRVIDPDELQYLQETEDPRLTIVTCYPFYFAGSAPQRFLVRAAPAPLTTGKSS